MSSKSSFKDKEFTCRFWCSVILFSLAWFWRTARASQTRYSAAKSTTILRRKKMIWSYRSKAGICLLTMISSRLQHKNSKTSEFALTKLKLLKHSLWLMKQSLKKEPKVSKLKRAVVQWILKPVGKREVATKNSRWWRQCSSFSRPLSTSNLSIPSWRVWHRSATSRWWRISIRLKQRRLSE